MCRQHDWRLRLLVVTTVVCGVALLIFLLYLFTCLVVHQGGSACIELNDSTWLYFIGCAFLFLIGMATALLARTCLAPDKDEQQKTAKEMDF
jgi:hypothetical protein